MMYQIVAQQPYKIVRRKVGSSAIAWKIKLDYARFYNWSIVVQNYILTTIS